MRSKIKVGIIGYGMVGRAVGAWFTAAAIYSPHKYPNGLAAVNRCKIVFICVPSPYSKKTGYDLSAVHQTAQALTGRKIVVLKSTVLPGTTTMLQKKYPRHIWLFNPEFLVEKTHIHDFLKPDRQIIGLARNSANQKSAAKKVMKTLPPAPFSAITTSSEAELIKLGANSFGALKVVYANMIYDLSRRAGANYDVIRTGIGRDPRITPSWLKVMFDGYRGYSGKCFPKDVGALIWYGRHKKNRLPLLETAESINMKLLPKHLRHH